MKLYSRGQVIRFVLIATIIAAGLTVLIYGRIFSKSNNKNIADSVTNASSEKVISEKLLMQLLEWKTEM